MDDSTQLDEVARRANVPIEFLRRLAALGAVSDDLATALDARARAGAAAVRLVGGRLPTRDVMRLVDQKPCRSRSSTPRRADAQPTRSQPETSRARTTSRSRSWDACMS